MTFLAGVVFGVIWSVLAFIAGGWMILRGFDLMDGRR